MLQNQLSNQLSSRVLLHLAVIAAMLVFMTAAAAAATAGGGGGMPWEGPLQKIMQSLSGPVARACGIIAIVLLGIGVAFSEGGSMLKKGLMVVLGLTIALSAGSWGLSFVGAAGGLLV